MADVKYTYALNVSSGYLGIVNLTIPPKKLIKISNDNLEHPSSKGFIKDGSLLVGDSAVKASKSYGEAKPTPPAKPDNAQEEKSEEIVDESSGDTEASNEDQSGDVDPSNEEGGGDTEISKEEPEEKKKKKRSRRKRSK